MAPTERWPAGLRKAMMYSLAVLALVSYLAWEASRPEGAPVSRFQGGIAQPELFSSPSPAPTVTAGPTPGAVETQPSTGSLVITVTDENRAGVAGIDVQIDGARSATLRTDRNGKITLVGPAGYYAFRIDAGCTATLQILSAATGRGGIVEGRSGTGQLTIHWRHRYRPWHPSFPSVTPFWPVGEVIDVGFYVADRCDQNARAAGARFDSFAFKPSPNLELAGTPLFQADEKGHGYVKVRCTGPGPATLVVFDKSNPSDEEMDLLAEDVSSGTRPECR